MSGRREEQRLLPLGQLMRWCSSLKSHSDDLGSVDAFKHLGRLMSHNDADWPAVTSNVRKARAKWAKWAQLS